MSDEFKSEVEDLYLEHSFHKSYYRNCSTCYMENKEREEIISLLTEEQEEKLQDAFVKGDGWACNKDNIEDLFEGWVENLPLETFKKIINA